MRCVYVHACAQTLTTNEKRGREKEREIGDKDLFIIIFIFFHTTTKSVFKACSDNLITVLRRFDHCQCKHISCFGWIDGKIIASIHQSLTKQKTKCSPRLKCHSGCLISTGCSRRTHG